MSEQKFIFQNAQNLMSMGEYEEGVKLLRELGNYPIALRLLGYAYYNGDGVEENHNKALENFVSAYEHGDTDPGVYELIHELVCENLNNYKKSKCDFKEEIDPTNKRLKDDLNEIVNSPMPFDDAMQIYVSMHFSLAFDKCCNIIKVFLAHQGKNKDLSSRLLFLEAMKLGLTELEFITDAIPCHDKITEDCDFSFSNDKSFTASVFAMRRFVENVDEIINNNKSDF